MIVVAVVVVGTGSGSGGSGNGSGSGNSGCSTCSSCSSSSSGITIGSVFSSSSTAIVERSVAVARSYLSYNVVMLLYYTGCIPVERMS